MIDLAATMVGLATTMVGPVTTMVGLAATMVVMMRRAGFPGMTATCSQSRARVIRAPQAVRVRRGDRAESTLGSPRPQPSKRLLHPSNPRALSS